MSRPTKATDDSENFARKASKLAEASILHHRMAAQGYQDSFVASIRQGYARDEANLEESFAREQARLLRKQQQERKLLLARQQQELASLRQQYERVAPGVVANERHGVDDKVSQFESDHVQAGRRQEAAAAAVAADKAKGKRSMVQTEAATSLTETSPIMGNSAAVTPLISPTAASLPTFMLLQSGSTRQEGWNEPEGQQPILTDPKAASKAASGSTTLTAWPATLPSTRQSGLPMLSPDKQNTIFSSARAQNSSSHTQPLQMRHEPWNAAESEHIDYSNKTKAQQSPRPLDLRLLVKHLRAGVYGSADAFVRDLELVAEILRARHGRDEHNVPAQMNGDPRSEYHEALRSISSRCGGNR